MRYRTIILWGLFIGIILLGAVYVIQSITGSSNSSLLNFSGLPLVGKIILGLAALLLILHSVWTLGVFRGLGLVALGFTTGLVFEVLGVKYGTVFGGYYFYDAAIHPRILDVPPLIPLIWAGFIYAGYSIVSSFSIWLNRGGLGAIRHRMIFKVSFAALSALVVLAIDLIMEPLQVAAGNWRWLEDGPYFSIPAGNFLGWFLVAFLTILIFMISQDYLPPKRGDFEKPVLLIPVLGYGLLCMILVFWALRVNMTSLAAIGLIAMSPTVVVNLTLFLRWRTLAGELRLNRSCQTDVL